MPEDAFDILGLEPAFDLDPARIERAFLTRAAQTHPDLVGDDDRAAALAARLTDARRQLDNLETRANLLLARLGGPGKDQDKSLPSGFLVEIMDLRERVECALDSGDPDARRKELDAALAQRQDYHHRIRDLFILATPNRGGDAPLLRQIRTQLNAWRYIERLIEQLDSDYPADNPERGRLGPDSEQG
ncbi:MAG: hypothetical protein KIT24_07240 [Phycisphaeraceae bacterium]|nr:hypothetical protein [Phycisphaeraceae bacterium]